MALAILFREVPFKKSVSPTEMIELVVKWKKNYFLVCDLVMDINHFLGQSLAVFICFTFCSSIGYSFFVSYVSFMSDEVPFLLYFEQAYTVTQNIIGITLLAHTSEKIPHQVGCDRKLLRKN